MGFLCKNFLQPPPRPPAAAVIYLRCSDFQIEIKESKNVKVGLQQQILNQESLKAFKEHYLFALNF